MLYALSLYQVISCSISLLWLLYFTIVTQQIRFIGLFSYLLCAILLALTLYVLYINTEYVTKRKVTNRYKAINRWFNFFQLLHVSLMGVTFYFLSGPAILPEFIYSDKVSGRLLLDFGFTFNLTFRGNESDISAGINLVSALYLYFFHQAVRKAEAEDDIELDLFKSKSTR